MITAKDFHEVTFQTSGGLDVCPPGSPSCSLARRPSRSARASGLRSNRPRTRRSRVLLHLSRRLAACTHVDRARAHTAAARTPSSASKKIPPRLPVHRPLRFDADYRNSGLARGHFVPAADAVWSVPRRRTRRSYSRARSTAQNRSVSAVTGWPVPSHFYKVIIEVPEPNRAISLPDGERRESRWSAEAVRSDHG